MLVSIVKIYMFLSGTFLVAVSVLSAAKNRYDSMNIFRQGKNSLLSKVSSLILQALTGAGLITGAAGLYYSLSFGLPVSLFSLAAMVYISLKGLTWEPKNRPDLFRLAAFGGSAVCIVILMLSYKQ